jgi:hypothetical protein
VGFCVESGERAVEFAPALPGGDAVGDGGQRQAQADARPSGDQGALVFGCPRQVGPQLVERAGVADLLVAQTVLPVLEPEGDADAAGARGHERRFVALLDLQHLEAALVLDDDARFERPPNLGRRRVDEPLDRDFPHRPVPRGRGA